MHDDDELSHNPFLSEARDGSQDEAVTPMQAGSSTGIASAAGHSESVDVGRGMSSVAGGATMNAQNSHASMHSNDGQAAQPNQQQQAPRRPARLALRDNADWKDEIKIIDAEKTREGSTSSFIAYIIRSDVGFDMRHVLPRRPTLMRLQTARRYTTTVLRVRIAAQRSFPIVSCPYCPTHTTAPQPHRLRFKAG